MGKNSASIHAVFSQIIIYLCDMKKQTAIHTLSELPGEFDLEELFERLVFMEKVEKGLEQANKGRVSSHKKVIERFRKRWPK